jgi:hypothetical protein
MDRISVWVATIGLIVTGALFVTAAPSTAGCPDTV